MHEILSQVFSWVCGQNPAHTWTCDGVGLPCCQRCTGLYLGALVAFLLQHSLRLRMSGWFLQIHGVFLMVMVPLGFHWVPQGPLLRAWSGALFGFAVVTFLRVSLAGQTAGSEAWLTQTTRHRLYWAGLGATLAGLAALDFYPDRISPLLVSVQLICGAVALWMLGFTNVWQGLRWLRERLRAAMVRTSV